MSTPRVNRATAEHIKEKEKVRTEDEVSLRIVKNKTHTVHTVSESLSKKDGGVSSKDGLRLTTSSDTSFLDRENISKTLNLLSKRNDEEHLTLEIKPSKKEIKENGKKEETKVKKTNSIIFKRLVLAGGGLRGLAYIGAIKALRKLKILDNLEEILGTSIGAVFALLIVLDFSDDELHDFLLHFHYDRLKDLDFFKIMSEWGVESGSKIENFLIQLIRQKTGLTDPTFLELYKKIGRTLIVNAVALETFDLHYFSYLESPNMKVVKGIRASISVPGLFTPVHHNNHVFVDGGLLNNFPIDYFKSPNKKGMDEVLGICFDQVVKPPGLKGLNGMNAYISSVIGCILNRIERLGEAERKIGYYSDQRITVITIPTGDITAFQSTLDRTKRLYLYHHGEQAVMEYFGEAKDQPKNKHEPKTQIKAKDEQNMNTQSKNKLRRASI